MIIKFYHSSLCPRCRKALTILERHLQHHDIIVLEKIDILKQPVTAFKDRVFFIPTLITSRNQKMTIFKPNEEKIAQYIRTALVEASKK